jgi:large subunit ribosomal protein L6
MSRIGKNPITIPAGVEVNIQGNLVSVKGPKGHLSQEIAGDIAVAIDNGQLVVTRANDLKENRSKHGLYRSLLSNMVLGVSKGWTKQMELVGVGYRASVQGQILELSLGFSHIILLQVPSEVKVEAQQDKGKNPIITLTSHDNQLIGAVAAKIRSFRKPEPYKGKGVRFVGEQIRRKAGKSASKK